MSGYWLSGVSPPGPWLWLPTMTLLRLRTVSETIGISWGSVDSRHHVHAEIHHDCSDPVLRSNSVRMCIPTVHRGWERSECSSAFLKRRIPP